MEAEVFSVSQLNRYLKQRLDLDPVLSRITLRGEIGTFHRHPRSGHCYFTLKDEQASVKCVMFRYAAQALSFQPMEGMAVVAKGSVQLYEKEGALQVYVQEMQPDGLGALYLAFEQLKRKLQSAGLFDPAIKKPLPRFPQTIGVVTSPSGAALQDIIQILSRRYPLVELRVYGALVQGEKAPASLRAAVAKAAKDPLDLLIIARGGGSAEDLFCFNDEQLAYEIYRCPIPVISAVGHEVDYTICDFVADLRAPTPSAAAELAVPEAGQILSALADTRYRLTRSMNRKLEQILQRLLPLQTRLTRQHPVRMLEQSAQRLDEASSRLERAVQGKINQKSQEFLALTGRLEALSPLAVLNRGYTITQLEGKAVTSLAQVQPGDQITTTVRDGTFTSIIGEIDYGTEKSDAGRKSASSGNPGQSTGTGAAGAE